MKILTSTFTDVGLKREKNEDSYLSYVNHKKKLGLFVVTDGMGSYVNGEKASQEIIRGFTNWTEQFHEKCYIDFAHMLNSLRCNLEESNQRIYVNYNNKHICGSTCVLLFIYKELYATISVGDSRIYLKRGKECKSITSDDVWENQAHVRKKYTEETLSTHENYGKLVAACGISDKLNLSIRTDRIKKQDLFLLCSDGIYKMCGEEELTKVMKKNRLVSLVRIQKQIVNYVFQKGANDNATLVLVKVK